MRLSRLLRIFLALGISLLLLALLVVVLYLTRAAFEVWDYLRASSPWFLTLYAGGVLTLTGAGGWVVWRLLMPRAHGEPEQAEPPAPPSEEVLEQRVVEAEKSGVDVGEARGELLRLQQRRAAGRVYVSLFGEISSGKSSLIKALLPNARAEVNVRGGTTRRVNEYLRARLWELLEAEGETLAALNATLFASSLSDQVGQRILDAKRGLGERVIRTYCAAKGVTVALNPVPLADLAAAVAYYSTYLVGQAAEHYLAQGKSWGEGGPKQVVRDILNWLDRDSILAQARVDISERLRSV